LKTIPLGLNLGYLYIMIKLKRSSRTTRCWNTSPKTKNLTSCGNYDESSLMKCKDFRLLPSSNGTIRTSLKNPLKSLQLMIQLLAPYMQEKMVY
jgi:hypothetical protein